MHIDFPGKGVAIAIAVEISYEAPCKGLYYMWILFLSGYLFASKEFGLLSPGRT
jgi:hypothetical protein